MVDDSERDHALLTRGQRKFLQSDGKGYSRQMRSEYRNAIKNRVHDSVLDFSILWEHWDETEREEVFDNPARDEFGEGLADIIALVYSEAFLGGQFKNLLSRGVNKAEADLAESDDNLIASVTFEVNRIERTHHQDAVDKFGQGKLSDMTDGEVRALINILRHTRVLTHSDLNEMSEDILEQLKDTTDGHEKNRMDRADNAREKQRRKLQDKGE